MIRRQSLHQSTSLAESLEGSRSSRLQTLDKQLIDRSPYIRYTNCKYYLTESEVNVEHSIGYGIGYGIYLFAEVLVNNPEGGLVDFHVLVLLESLDLVQAFALLNHVTDLLHLVNSLAGLQELQQVSSQNVTCASKIKNNLS